MSVFLACGAKQSFSRVNNCWTFVSKFSGPKAYHTFSTFSGLNHKSFSRSSTVLKKQSLFGVHSFQSRIYSAYHSNMTATDHPLKLVQDIEISYSPTRVFLWVSERTGLQCVLIQQAGTIVEGHFSVASEIHNDSGAPHTLEHLVFMGSKKYPYKGLLDTLGNKMMSNTNAWTAVDQTVFTMSTVGWESFSHLLPVYIDHVVNPTITQDACTTEIYYIDGEGEEKGVVYSEMQGIENHIDSIQEFVTKKLLYGNESAFSSETGGLTKNLRVLTCDQIREFHKDIYRPDNLSIIVSGEIDPREFEVIIRKIDNDLPSIKTDPPHKRPFVDTEPKNYPGKNVVETVEFPENDESFGQISLTWIGPDVHNTLDGCAISILLKYLSTEGVGPLSKELVEIPDPLATDVYIDESNYLKQEFNVSLSNVATDKLEEVYDKTVGIIKKVYEDKKALDTTHLRELLERTKYQDIKSCELNPREFIDTAIVAFMYGSRDGKSLRDWVIDVSEYDKLMEWTSEQWLEVFKKYFIDNPSVSLLLKPSKELSQKHKQDAKDRIEATKKKYGPEGLKKLQEIADKAQAENNKPVPQSVLDEFKAPDLTKIKFIETISAKGGRGVNDKDIIPSKIQTIVEQDTPKDFPFYVSFEDYKTNFVTIRVFLSTREVDAEFLPYIDVFFSEVFSLPMLLDDGTILEFKDTIRQVKADTLQANAHLGIGADFEDLYSITVQARSDKYQEAVKWVHRALTRAQFSDERINVILDKHINRLTEYKRKGSFIARSSMNRTLYTMRSMIRASDLLETEEQFKKLKEELKPETIRANLEKIRSQMVKSNNMRIFVAGQVEILESPVKTWNKLLKDVTVVNDELVKVPLNTETCAVRGDSISKICKVSSMPSTESSYAYLVSSGPSDFAEKDIPALYTACEYLNAVEGPIWRGVRGAGYAYGASVIFSIDSGLIKLDIYRGADTPKAIKACEEMVKDFVSGKTPIEDHLLEGAKNMVAHNVAYERQNANSSAAFNYIDFSMKGRSRDYLKRYLEAVANDVSVSSVVAAMKKYMLPLFDNNKSMAFIACHSSMTEDVKEKFEKDGYKVEVEEMEEVAGSEEDDESDMEEDED